MLAWINGPFGGGKTQTAHEIRRRLAGSIICDPELLGFGLNRMTPAALRGDLGRADRAGGRSHRRRRRAFADPE